MKKLYSLTIVSLLLIAGNSFSQNFSYTNNTNTLADIPGAEIVFSSSIINSTSTALTLRVTRQQDVIGDAPTWTSAFCMDLCYLPDTDSVTYTPFAPGDTVDFTFHMYTSTTPDHAWAKMRWKNNANGANVFNQTFIGVTDGTLGLNSLEENTANVSIYPMPATSGDVFSMNVNTVKSTSALTLVVYNMFGSVVNTTSVIAGVNLMSLNLPAGIYSYSILSEGNILNSGKLSMVK